MAAGVELALEAQAPEERESAQLDLLGAPLSPECRQMLDARSAKTGRPPGARNKRTIETAKYLLSRYTSPLEVLAQIATARVDELVMGIGCTKLEAMQEKRLAAIALLPYVHQKQPVAVDVTNRREIRLVIVEGLDDPAAAGAVDEGVGIVEVVAREMESEE